MTALADLADRVQVLGRPVDRVAMAEAVDRISRWLEAGLSPEDAARLVVTANPEIVYNARHDQELAQVLASATLVVADGIGIVWAARRYGRPVPERVAGVDLMMALLQRAAERDWRPFFLGTRPEVVARAAERARELFPGLQLAGYHHGYFSDDQEAQVLDRIRQAAPDLLLAGMGARRELTWLHRHRHTLPVPVTMGVGGSLDVLAGAVQRAPGWVQAVHLEWLYRLLKEPRRWRRQAVLPLFVLAVLRDSRRP